MAFHSEDDLPQDIRNRFSKTFDFDFIQNLLRNTYYKGPIPEGEGGRGGNGLRRKGYALAGMPSSHRKSVLGKAKDVNIIQEVANGYVTTTRGANLLQEIAICEECSEEKIPSEMPVGPQRRGRVYTTFLIACPSCNEFKERGEDGALHYGNHHRFQRDDESLQEAIGAVENSNNVDVWLNDMSLDEAKNQLSS